MANAPATPHAAHSVAVASPKNQCREHEGDQGQRRQQAGGVGELLAKAHVRLWRRLAGRVHQRPQRDVAAIQNHHDQTWQEAGQEHLDERHLRLNGVDDHDDGRWNEQPERAGSRHRADGHGAVVAALFQFGQRDLGDRRAGRGRGARHHSEDTAGDDVDVQQAAGEAVDPRRDAAEQILRQPCTEENFAHPDEQRQGGQRPGGIGAPGRRRQNAADRHVGDHHHGREAAQHQRHADPKTGNEHDAKHRDEQQGDLDQLQRHDYRFPAAARSMTSSRVLGGSLA